MLRVRHLHAPLDGGRQHGRGFTIVWLLTLIATLLVSGCATHSGRHANDEPPQLEQQGMTAYRAGDYRRARTLWHRGLDLAQAQGDRQYTSSLLIALARLDESVGQYDRSLARSIEALRLARLQHDIRLQARAQSLLALAYRRISDYAAARQYSLAALGLANRLGDKGLASDNRRNLGAVLQARGDLDGAQQHYRQALALAREASDADREADALNDLGGLYRRKGAYREALQHYNNALALTLSHGYQPTRVKLLGNLCLIRQNLNALDAALDDCQRSLRLARTMGDRVREANNLNNIGAIHRARGEFDQALRQYRSSLVIKRELGDRAGVARTLNNIGELYLARGESDRALTALDDAMRIQHQIGDRAGESAARYNLGLIYRAQGDTDRALAQFKQALIVQLQVGERELLWRLYDDLSRIYAERGSARVAIFFGKQAVNTLQTVRGDIRSLDKAVQRAYLADKVRAYKHLAGLLIDQGRLPEAQQVLDMLKEEEYAGFVVRGAATDRNGEHAGFSAPEKPLDDALQAFQADLLTQAGEYDRLRAKKQRLFLEGKPLDATEQQRFDAIKQTLEHAGRALDSLVARLERELPKVPQISEIDDATLKFLFNLQGTVRDVSEQTGTRAVMLHYLVTTDRLYIVLTTPSAQLARQVKIPATELYRRIQALRAALLSPASAVHEPAAALYDLLIAPVADDLKQAGAQMLWVSMDGALRYIPLAALYNRNTGHWLVQDYAVAMLTQAAKSAWKDRPSPTWTVAGLGLSRKIPGFARLTAVTDELDGIVKQQNRDDPDGVLPGIIDLDDAFTAASLEDLLDLQLFQVIHIASHFVLPATGDVRNAFLLLGNGDKFGLDRFRDLRFDKVDLLTLSACNTAVGLTTGGQRFDALSGREVEGLGALVQGRGAASVLATLWEVADVATATLMQRFYALHTEGMTKAEALRQAQLDFITGRSSSGDGDAGRGAGLAETAAAPYSHPYYWAPFILMGNWE